jgi:hypothetical protein
MQKPQFVSCADHDNITCRGAYGAAVYKAYCDCFPDSYSDSEDVQRFDEHLGNSISIRLQRNYTITLESHFQQNK